MAPAVLSFLVAGLSTLAEYITTKCPHTGVLLLHPRRGWALYSYCIIYGAIALAITLLLSTLIESKVVAVEGLGLANPWLQAICVGLGIKGFLHIRLFKAGSVPIGVETLVQIFEPWLLEDIELQHYCALTSSLSPYVERYPDIALVRTRVKANLPRTFSQEKRAAISTDVDKCSSVAEALDVYVSNVGFRALELAFPRSSGPPAV